jgi:hypothetical protein
MRGWFATWARRAALLFVCVVATGVAVALVVAVAMAPARGQTLIEVLKVLSSWPLVVGLLGTIALLYWRGEIAELISRLATLKAPGGVDIAFSQPQSPPGVVEAAKAEQSSEQQEAAQRELNELRDAKATSDQERERLYTRAVTLLDAQLRESAFWHFSFLRLFYVPRTKIVFRSLCARSAPITYAEFHDFYRVYVPSPLERNAILHALVDHGLVHSPDGVTFTVTDTGYQFLQHLDQFEPMVPPPAPAPEHWPDEPPPPAPMPQAAGTSATPPR